jgi:hypothetical protein
MTTPDEVPTSENIQKIITALERDTLLQRSAADCLSNAVTRFTESSGFAVVHALFFAVWLIANTSTVTHRPPFDPYPFSFLTLVVSPRWRGPAGTEPLQHRGLLDRGVPQPEARRWPTFRKPAADRADCWRMRY